MHFVQSQCSSSRLIPISSQLLRTYWRLGSFKRGFSLLQSMSGNEAIRLASLTTSRLSQLLWHNLLPMLAWVSKVLSKWKTLVSFCMRVSYTVSQYFTGEEHEVSSASWSHVFIRKRNQNINIPTRTTHRIAITEAKRYGTWPFF